MEDASPDENAQCSAYDEFNQLTQQILAASGELDCVQYTPPFLSHRKDTRHQQLRLLQFFNDPTKTGRDLNVIDRCCFLQIIIPRIDLAAALSLARCGYVCYSHYEDELYSNRTVLLSKDVHVYLEEQGLQIAFPEHFAKVMDIFIDQDLEVVGLDIARKHMAVLTNHSMATMYYPTRKTIVYDKLASAVSFISFYVHPKMQNHVFKFIRGMISDWLSFHDAEFELVCNVLRLYPPTIFFDSADDFVLSCVRECEPAFFKPIVEDYFPAMQLRFFGAADYASQFHNRVRTSALPCNAARKMWLATEVQACCLVVLQKLVSEWLEFDSQNQGMLIDCNHNIFASYHHCRVLRIAFAVMCTFKYLEQSPMMECISVGRVKRRRNGSIKFISGSVFVSYKLLAAVDCFLMTSRDRRICMDNFLNTDEPLTTGSRRRGAFAVRICLRRERSTTDQLQAKLYKCSGKMALIQAKLSSDLRRTKHILETTRQSNMGTTMMLYGMLSQQRNINNQNSGLREQLESVKQQLEVATNKHAVQKRRARGRSFLYRQEKNKVAKLTAELDTNVADVLSLQRQLAELQEKLDNCYNETNILQMQAMIDDLEERERTLKANWDVDKAVIEVLKERERTLQAHCATNQSVIDMHQMTITEMAASRDGLICAEREKLNKEMQLGHAEFVRYLRADYAHQLQTSEPVPECSICFAQQPAWKAGYKSPSGCCFTCGECLRSHLRVQLEDGRSLESHNDSEYHCALKCPCHMSQISHSDIGKLQSAMLYRLLYWEGKYLRSPDKPERPDWWIGVEISKVHAFIGRITLFLQAERERRGPHTGNAPAVKQIVDHDNTDFMVTAVVNRIVNRCLTLHCPKCGTAFLDWDACGLLKCQCGTPFCCWCLKDLSALDENVRFENAHMHVADCQAAHGGTRQVFVDDFEHWKKCIGKLKAERMIDVLDKFWGLRDLDKVTERLDAICRDDTHVYSEFVKSVNHKAWKARVETRAQQQAHEVAQALAAGATNAQ